MVTEKEGGGGAIIKKGGCEEKGARKGETVSRLHVCCVGKSPVSPRHLVLDAGGSSVNSSSQWCQYDQPRWPCYVSDLCSDILTLSPPCRSLYSPVWVSLGGNGKT